MTTVQTYLERADACKKAICLLLGYSEMDYAEMQYRNGLAYLMWYLPCDDAARQQLERSKLYWAWFKNLWTAQDESFLSYRRSLSECSKRTLQELYENLQCPRALAVEVKPNQVVLSVINKPNAYAVHSTPTA